jgi:xylulokinase
MTTAANIFNVPIVKKTSRGGSAYGAAMLAAVGSGDFANLDVLSIKWGLQKHDFIYEPDFDLHVYYQKLYKIYLKSYLSLKEIFHDLHDCGVGDRYIT